MLLIVVANLEMYDRSVEEAAQGLGSGPVRTFLLITLPLILPGVLAAGLFSFVVSFTNFTVSFFLSGGGVMTLPLWLYDVINYVFDPVVAVVSVLIVVMTVALALAMDGFVGLGRMSRR